jgi:hypothetical protein
VASAQHELSLTRDLSLSPKNALITGGQRATRALTFTMYDESMTLPLNCTKVADCLVSRSAYLVNARQYVTSRNALAWYAILSTTGQWTMCR